MESQNRCFGRSLDITAIPDIMSWLITKQEWYFNFSTGKAGLGQTLLVRLELGYAVVCTSGQIIIFQLWTIGVIGALPEQEKFVLYTLPSMVYGQAGGPWMTEQRKLEDHVTKKNSSKLSVPRRSQSPCMKGTIMSWKTRAVMDTNFHVTQYRVLKQCIS